MNGADKLFFERECAAQGFCAVAGVDEVGRGPLAGPVVCAAVVMPRDRIVAGVDDSKKLSAKKREAIAEEIRKTAVCYRIEEIPADVIDEINILQATRLCMKHAVDGLDPPADFVLTDGNMTLDIRLPQRSIVKGDALSYSVGAASILAKVYRDALMKEYAKEFPEYGFEKNAGYGTAAHIAAIREKGICRIHRKTFVTKFWDGRERTPLVHI
ncbi:MAG: ribonuclease HII [Clostridia bacterium]|nr:ribonuclease HII [Clostridia bacterium]